MTVLALLLAIVGALALVYGVVLIYVPAAIVLAGLELLTAAYLAAYRERQGK